MNYADSTPWRAWHICKQGKGWLYCNIGYAILGLAVARAARAAGIADGLIELLQDRLFHPLGMCSTSYYVPECDRHRLVEGHLITDSVGTLDSTPKLDEEGRGYRVPNGGVYSTLSDLASYIGMLSESGPTTVLSSASLDKMAAPIAQAAGPSSGSSGSSYGLGLFHRDDSPRIIYHGGATPGFTCNFAFDRITVRTTRGPLQLNPLAARSRKACCIVSNHAGLGLRDPSQLRERRSRAACENITGERGTRGH